MTDLKLDIEKLRCQLLLRRNADNLKVILSLNSVLDI